jgi:prefoldin subunit 5
MSSSIVPLSISERQIFRIDDVQQTIKDNLLGAFDVNKIQAAFDILFGLISEQQGEIDKLNKDVPRIRERTDTLETTVEYNEKEQQVINGDQSSEITQMKKQIEVLKKSLSDINEGKPVKSRAAVEMELMASSDKENMEFPSADKNEYERYLQSKRHSLDSIESRPDLGNNINELGENLREFTTDIAEYYDSIEVVLNENLNENKNENKNENENGLGVSSEYVSALSALSISGDTIDSQPININWDGRKGSSAVSLSAVSLSQSR